MSRTCGCGDVPAKKVLLFACSGGSNVGELSDRAARQLMAQGRGSMFCLAGVGAELPNMVQTAREADLNLVIDGCPLNCAKLIFDQAGLTNYVQLKVTDLGITKQKGIPATEAQIAQVVARAQEMLAG